MTNIEDAYRILELNVGAGFKEVSEAREDFLVLWDPNRLSHHPRLRSRATGKIQEINQAYEILMEHLGRSEVGRGPWSAILPPGGEARTGKTAAAASGAASTEPTSTSLFDEVFSGKETSEVRRVPAWMIVVLVTSAALAIGYVAQSTREERQPASEKKASASMPQPLETLEAVSASGETPASTHSADPDGEGNVSIVTSRQERSVLDQSSPVPQQQSLRDSGGRPARSQPSKAAPPVPASPKIATAKKKAANVPSAKAGRPVLVRQQPEEVEAKVPKTQAEQSSAEQQKRLEEEEKAYQVLLQKSTAARRLVAGAFTERFSEWKVIKHSTPEIWIDLMAAEPNGKLVHYIWSVDLEAEAIRPMSEAARNLGRGN